MVNKLNKSTPSQHAIIEEVIQRQEDVVTLLRHGRDVLPVAQHTVQHTGDGDSPL